MLRELKLRKSTSLIAVVILLCSSACATNPSAEEPRQSAADPCPTNWAKIATAFAKPQLGGFFASMGDASTEIARQKDECEGKVN